MVTEYRVSSEMPTWRHFGASTLWWGGCAGLSPPARLHRRMFEAIDVLQVDRSLVLCRPAASYFYTSTPATLEGRDVMFWVVRLLHS